MLFNCVGDKEGVLSINKEDGINIINLENSIVKGIYELKNIILLSKLSSITEEFSLYMKNNFAITSLYSFGENGSITTILSPINEEHINNLSYDYSDDEDEIELIKDNLNNI